jgi:hypothetical protein
VGKTYTLAASLGNETANASFAVENFREPDLVGDAMVVGAYAAPLIVAFFIVVFIVIFLYWLFILKQRG